MTCHVGICPRCAAAAVASIGNVCSGSVFDDDVGVVWANLFLVIGPSKLAEQQSALEYNNPINDALGFFFSGCTRVLLAIAKEFLKFGTTTMSNECVWQIRGGGGGRK